MIILGIESSCDDTSVAVLRDGDILSVATNTQLEHIAFGGVIPEIASRAHIKNFPSVLDKALTDADIKLTDIDAIGVTFGPGLVGPLLVGVNFAKGLAFSLSKPLVPVNHIEAHIFANFIDNPEIEYPFIVLIVSGGHTELIYVPEIGKYELIGKTRDDAAGECIDKVSKMLGLGFPGGKILDELAKKGDNNFEKFPRGMPNSLDFSFSGLKTSLKYYIEKHDKEFIKTNIENIAASFLDSVTDSLINKLFKAVKIYKIGTVLLAGGVSANSVLREKLAENSKKKHIKFHYPHPKYCTDNAAMVAITAYRKLLSDSSAKYE
ncbi:MAG: tRNA (adenosine(37)-N6)-threonylcarbamoyltransferase complex transferase subunit TsaD, partial [Candidatus Delongbacteria bacterium]|nr:tRNA (adenosine(37)-N6)-threonylcarbamoyltransferase complex transferase subunit TsaD [Candidatus Delongbacteria bacterium]MCG2760033.1 tRNA (adenosine(37)-N6)-threonylcarbamoyltransferase complex transferase subunit TsaD [Candidatus Delongbacteria bacterium]